MVVMFSMMNFCLDFTKQRIFIKNIEYSFFSWFLLNYAIMDSKLEKN